MTQFEPNGPDQPEQPSVGKIMQQLQGKWRSTRLIAADGDESITPAATVWEFKDNRIVVRDGGPGGTMQANRFGRATRWSGLVAFCLPIY